MSAIGIETISVPTTTAAVQISVRQSAAKKSGSANSSLEIVEADERLDDAEAVDVVHGERDDLAERPDE